MCVNNVATFMHNAAQHFLTYILFAGRRREKKIRYEKKLSKKNKFYQVHTYTIMHTYTHILTRRIVQTRSGAFMERRRKKINRKLWVILFMWLACAKQM